MIIDTYVYFVSYEDTTNIYGEKIKTIQNREYTANKKIDTILDIRRIEDSILIYNNEKARLDTVSIDIINFQLLDSYNKEEREKV